MRTSEVMSVRAASPVAVTRERNNARALSSWRDAEGSGDPTGRCAGALSILISRTYGFAWIGTLRHSQVVVAAVSACRTDAEFTLSHISRERS
jgi:hypothetical protein